MTGRRAVTVAVAGSLLLHGGAAAGLWLLVGAPVVPPAQALPRLFVDLVDDPVVVAGPPTATAPVTGARAAVPGPPAPAPSRAAPAPPPPPAPAAAAEVAPPPSPPAVIAAAPPPAPAGPVVVALVPAPAVIPAPESPAPPPRGPAGEAPAPAAPAPALAAASTPALGGPIAVGAGRSGAGAPGTPAPADAAPGPGAGAGRLAALPAEAPTGVPPEYDAYVRRLRDLIQARLAYPWQAARRGLQGVVELEIQIEASGRLGQVDVVGGVPAPLLQRAALAAVREATPAPFPPGVAARPLTIRLPVVFELR